MNNLDKNQENEGPLLPEMFNTGSISDNGAYDGWEDGKDESVGPESEKDVPWHSDRQTIPSEEKKKAKEEEEHAKAEMKSKVIAGIMDKLFDPELLKVYKEQKFGNTGSKGLKTLNWREHPNLHPRTISSFDSDDDGVEYSIIAQSTLPTGETRYGLEIYDRGTRKRTYHGHGSMDNMMAEALKHRNSRRNKGNTGSKE